MFGEANWNMFLTHVSPLCLRNFVITKLLWAQDTLNWWGETSGKLATISQKTIRLFKIFFPSRVSVSSVTADQLTVVKHHHLSETFPFLTQNVIYWTAEPFVSALAYWDLLFQSKFLCFDVSLPIQSTDKNLYLFSYVITGTAVWNRWKIIT